MRKKFSFVNRLLIFIVVFTGTITTGSCAEENAFKEISPGDAYQFQKNKKAVIVDVREENETSVERVKDSVLLPMSLMKNDPAAFKAKVEEFKKYDSVIVYCRSGRRSGIVGDELKKNGFNVYNLGAFDSWKTQKLPIEAKGTDNKAN